ncbi:MAG: hypothetical protein GY866_14400 [Proteobacteria bacterium]|nr:hypothetical protein [Pseudomonadota bacterium]
MTDRKVNYKFPMVIAFKEEKIALLEEINGRLQVFWDFDYPKNLKIKCDPKDEVLTPAEKNYRAAYSYSFFLVNIDLTPFVLGFYFSGHIGGDTHRLAKTGLGLLAGTGLYDIRVDICSDEDDFDPCGNSVLIEDDSIITIGDIYDRRFLLWGGNAQFTMYEYYTEDLAIDILSAYFWVVYTKLDMEFKQAKRNQSYDHTLEFRMDMIALEVFSFTHFF